MKHNSQKNPTNSVVTTLLNLIGVGDLKAAVGKVLGYNLRSE